MNKPQLDNLQAILQKIDDINVDEKLATLYVNQDLSAILIGQFSVPEYVAIIKRLIAQFKEEIQINGYYLPINYNYEANNQNLQNDITSLSNTLTNPNPTTVTQSAIIINKLVYYQISYGFWDRSIRKIHKAEDVKIKDLETKLNYTSEQFDQNIKNLEEACLKLAEEKDGLSQFTKQKQQELQQIANNLQSTNATNQQVSQLLTASTATDGKITAILKQQETNLENQQKKIDAQTKEFENQKSIYKTQETAINEKIQTVEKQITDFKQYLEFVESKTQYFEERNSYLDTLIGREVGASLFETFKQRKKELEIPVNKWLWIVVGASGLTFIAVLAIFTNIFTLLGPVPDFTWQNVVINALKSSPFFFLLFYSISQYNKERHYQEEYAFKSAVALTIKAYADILQDQNSKDNLIVQSVTEVYKTPNPDKGKVSKNDKSILDTATELLSTALDVMKKK